MWVARRKSRVNPVENSAKYPGIHGFESDILVYDRRNCHYPLRKPRGRASVPLIESIGFPSVIAPKNSTSTLAQSGAGWYN